jgi:hypothetical protein
MSLLTMMARATIAPTMPTEAKSIQAGKNAPKTTKDGAPASEQPVKETEARNRRAEARSWSVLGNGFTDVTNRIRIKLRSGASCPSNNSYATSVLGLNHVPFGLALRL